MSSIERVLFGKGCSIGYAIGAIVLAIVPESCFMLLGEIFELPDVITVIAGRVLLFLAIVVIANITYGCHRRNKKSVSIDEDNYSIVIEYGDLFDIHDGKVVINFDECFSTALGDRPSNVKPDSVCGQYLQKHPISDMQTLIDNAGVKPDEAPSLFESRARFKPGTIIPNGRYLLMAFAKLDENGLGKLTYEEYLSCLNELWAQLDLYHGTEDVYVPILGSTITRFDKDLTQQELLDIMISSYRLNPKKMNKPCCLHLVCKPREDFGLDNVFGIA